MRRESSLFFPRFFSRISNFSGMNEVSSDSLYREKCCSTWSLFNIVGPNPLPFDVCGEYFMMKSLELAVSGLYGMFKRVVEPGLI